MADEKPTFTSLTPVQAIGWPLIRLISRWVLPGDSADKNLPTMQEMQIHSLGWGRSPGGGHDNPLQYSCLENAMDRGAWWATARGVTKSRTRLSS